MDIHVFWEGPFGLNDLDRLGSESRDFGVYQIYGHHPLYGDNVLLYIGLAQLQTFQARINQEKWWKEQPDTERIEIYVGRLAGRNSISTDTWNTLIEQAEKLLIHAHQPVYNIQNKNSIPESDVLNNHIFNWQSYRDLFPEVSGSRFTSRFEHIEAAHIYDDSRLTD